MPNISFDIFFNQDIVNITASRSQGAPKVKPDWKVRTAPKLALKPSVTPETAFGTKETPKSDSAPKKTPPKLGPSKKSVPPATPDPKATPNKNSQANGANPKLSNQNVNKLSNGVSPKPKATPSVQGAPSQTKKTIPKLDKK